MVPTPHPDSDKPLVSMSYWSVVESVLNDHGIQQDWMTQHPALKLGRQTGRLRCRDYESLLLMALQAFGQALGVEAGLRGYPTKHGPLGVAFMSCATLADAMQLGMRYHPTRMPYYDMQLQTSPNAPADWIWVDVHERLHVDGLEQFGKLSALVEIATLIRTLAPVPRDQLHLYFTMAEPDFFHRYQDRLPPCTFGWPVDRLAIHIDALSARLPSANAEALKEACAQCDAEWVRLGLAGTWRERVLSHLQDPSLAPRTIEQMATRLCTSERTLKRQLQKEGCTFKSLQDAARLRAANSMLSDRALAIADIAQRIGFDDPAHFTRAYKRWTGEAPSAVRAALFEQQPPGLRTLASHAN